MSELVFEFKVVDRPQDPYFHTRWDRATPISVTAGTRDEAHTKLWKIMGKPPEHSHWIAKFLGAKECECSTKETP